MVEHEEFENVDSGAAKSVPIGVHDIRKGTHILMGEGRPCKVQEITTSKTGKHGHAKASIVGTDIFNGRKYEDSCPASYSKESPTIIRTEWIVNTVSDDGYVSLLDTKTGKQKEDLKLPNDTESDKETSKRITEGIEAGKTLVVVVLNAMDIEKIESCKESNE